jgi:NADH-quinone oxidoreductase subunit F
MGEMVLTRNLDAKDIRSIDGYRLVGGYEALESALRKTPQAVVDEVKASGLRGRGGAGFPTGNKWAFLPADKHPHYLAANADESEPGTYKDRFLIERNPHLVLEGIIISAYAIQAPQAFIYVRGEYREVQEILIKTVAEAGRVGLIGKNIRGTGWDLEVVVHGGAGAYICGEETALLESLEGDRGRPRPKPPFPAIAGLYQMPTVVNNVETLANVPFIVRNGAAAYRATGGTEKSPGTRLLCSSGHVARPGVYEVRLDMPVMDFINGPCGGMAAGKKLKAIQPGGTSTPFLTADMCATASFDYESIAAHGSFAGAGSVIVISEDQCMVEYTSRLADFYFHESCGKCTPCREGTFWLTRIFKRIEEGRGRLEDIDLIADVCGNINGKSLCALGDGAAMPIASSVQHFRAEYEEHVATGGCPHRAAAGAGAQ